MLRTPKFIGKTGPTLGYFFENEIDFQQSTPGTKARDSGFALLLVRVHWEPGGNYGSFYKKVGTNNK